MNKKDIFFYILCLIFFTSCDNSSRSIIYLNDCDGDDGWGGERSLATENVYSGKYSSKIDSTNRYSIAFSKPLKDISNNINFKEATVSLFAFLPKEYLDAKIIFNIVENKNNQFEHISYQVYDITRKGTIKNWFRIQKTFEFPNNLKADYILRIYVFSDAGDHLFIDNMKVELK